jgi:hypothetical protein
VVVKDDKEEVYEELRLCGASHLEKARRLEHLRNTQTCGLFLEDVLGKLKVVSNFKTKNLYHQKIPVRVFFDVLPPLTKGRVGEGS